MLKSTLKKSATGVALLSATSLFLVACSSADTGEDSSAAEETAVTEESDAADATGTVTIEDNNGTLEIAVPPISVVALDNRTFETLADWGVEFSAAARTLMPESNPYKNDESIPDIGNHREPNLELIVAAQPDLVITGQRFTQYYDDIASLVPGATQVLLDPRDGEPFAEELKRQTAVLGEIFGKTSEADQLIADFDASIQAVQEVYDGQTVMAVTTSGGNIGYLAPSVGRTLGPLFDIFDFEPALVVEGASEDHQGDDISVEAIADSNPDLILVMDRDAAVAAGDDAYVPANELIETNESLANVTAVVNDNIVYMPADTYTNEGIQTYTEFFNTLAEALSR